MQQHVLIGERILGPVQQFRPLAPAIRHHHEHYDGRGYPDALRGEEIPTLARVVAVADSYNAMTSNRPYRGAMAPDAALDQLRAVAGTQLDPVFAPTLCAVVSARDASYAVARTAEFVVEFDRLSAAATPLVAAR
jgi:HD-GYP domain-containing protein (c-di-GMP phosphodiesterase class II)